MVLLKRKPVIFAPLPSLSSVLQPLAQGPDIPTVPTGPSSSTAPADQDASATATANSAENASAGQPVPPDADDDTVQLETLRTVFRGEFAGAQGNVGPGKGKKAGTRVLNAPVPPTATSTSKTASGAAAAAAAAPAPEDAAGAVAPPDNGSEPPVAWRIWDRDCFYIPETGEIFTDYETYIARVTFYQQSLFQCEVSSKANISYYAAHRSETREARLLHARFPKQLKRPILSAVQFQIEGKLENLAEKIFDRYHNRFFEGERVFIDVEGDKYLALIVKAFPPRNVASASTTGEPVCHPYAADLNLSPEEIAEVDDPLQYIYNVRLIEEGGEHAVVSDSESWQGSTMEVQADKISRDRINYSRTMLKRFIRDCVSRDAAVYSPWVLKAAVAQRYNIPSEMTDEIRERIANYRERQMDKRKREREERLGLNHGTSEQDLEPEDEKPSKPAKKSKKDKDDEKKKEEEEKEKKKAVKYPIDDLLLEYSEEKDGPAGRIAVRPLPNKQLPFGENFERFLMSWSFLNVMGKALKLSPFTLDDYEQALYYNDQWSTAPSPLLKEIHATLINTLISDLAAGHDPVKPLALTGRTDDNDTDYWEGKKGATAETLRPVAEPLSNSWFNRFLTTRDDRKGWEAALVGCLWDRATLDTLPSYLDNILHLTFEDKPAPTRPTWSTGPSQASGNGLVQAKPDKRYSSLHHSHKLEIIAFLIELVQQTAAVRDYMEESTQGLTDVRKNQVDTKREWRRVRAEIDALAPKEEKEDEDGKPNVDENEGQVKEEREGSADPSVNGNNANGNGADSIANGSISRGYGGGLESSPAPVSEDIDMEDDDGPQNAVARRRAMKEALKEKAIEREAEEVQRQAKAAEEKAKQIEDEQVASQRQKLQEEYDVLGVRIRQLDFEFRAFMFTLRARPLGLDRFGNKVWWLDGLGSAPLHNEQGKIVAGTGRIYLQGVDEIDLQLLRQAAEASNAELHVVEGLSDEMVEAKRAQEEGEGRLAPGEWASYDTPEQLQSFVTWLNPRGQREVHLAKAIHTWAPEIEAVMHRRLIAAGLEEAPAPEVPEDQPVKKSRPTRKVAGGGGGDRVDEEGPGHLNWKNRRAKDK